MPCGRHQGVALRFMKPAALLRAGNIGGYSSLAWLICLKTAESRRARIAVMAVAP